MGNARIRRSRAHVVRMGARHGNADRRPACESKWTTTTPEAATPGHIVGVIARQLADIPEIEGQVASVEQGLFRQLSDIARGAARGRRLCLAALPISFQDYFQQSSRSLAGLTAFADTVAEEVQAVWAEQIDAGKAAMIGAAVHHAGRATARRRLDPDRHQRRPVPVRADPGNDGRPGGGQKDVVVPGLGDRDEIGAMA